MACFDVGGDAIKSRFDDTSGITDRNRIIGEIVNNDRASTNNAFFSYVGHYKGTIPNPTIFTDGDFLQTSTLLLNRGVQVFKNMLLVAAHYMNTTRNQGVFFNLAHANVALRTNVNSLVDFRVLLRKHGGESDETIRVAIAHGKAVECNTTITANLSWN